MSLPALQEWFHFVDKEKQVRIRIDGKVNQMMAEAAELKQWTISEVNHSRKHVPAFVFHLHCARICNSSLPGLWEALIRTNSSRHDSS